MKENHQASARNSHSNSSMEREELEDSTGLTMKAPPFSLLASSAQPTENAEAKPDGGTIEVTEPDTIFYPVDKNGEEMEPVTLPIGTVLVLVEKSKKQGFYHVYFTFADIDMHGYVKQSDFPGQVITEPETVTIEDSAFSEKTLIRRDSFLYAEADRSSAKEPILQNTAVTLKDIPDKHGWAAVIVPGIQKEGWVPKIALLQHGKDLPDESRIHQIQGREFDLNGKVTKNGDTLEGIIKEYYPKRGDSYADLRTIANVLLEFNNPQNLRKDPAIHVIKSGDLFEGFLQRHGVIYEDIEIMAGYDLLIPSWDYVQENMGKVKSGSMTEALVESFWEDGWGTRLDLSVAAGFLIFQAGLGGTLTFVKLGSEIVVTAEGKFSAGVGVGIGGGFMISGKKKKKGIGVRAGAEIEANQIYEGLIEFKIPLRAGLILNFMKELATMPFKEEKEVSTARLLQEFFQDDPLHYVNRAEVSVALEVHGNASASAGITTKGANVKSKDVGDGAELSSYGATNENRTGSDDQISNVSQPSLSKLKKLFTEADTEGVKEWGIWQISDLISTFTSLSLDGKVGMKGGLEYYKEKHKGKVRDHVAMYVEAELALELNLPILPVIFLGGAAAVKLIFVNEGNGNWKFKGPEVEYARGDVDEVSENATEISMGFEVGEEDSVGHKVLRILQSTQIKKRIALDFTPTKIQNALKGLDGVDALFPSDRDAIGYTLSGSLLVALDFEDVDPRREVLDLLELMVGGVTADGNGIVKGITNTIDLIFSDKSLDQKALAFLELIVKPSVLKTLQLHIEAGIGGGISAGAKAGLKLQGDIAGSATLFYEVDLQEMARQAFASKKDGTLKRDILRGIPDDLAYLVEKGGDALGIN